MFETANRKGTRSDEIRPMVQAPTVGNDTQNGRPVLIIPVRPLWRTWHSPRYARR